MYSPYYYYYEYDVVLVNQFADLPQQIYPSIKQNYDKCQHRSQK